MDRVFRDEIVCGPFSDFFKACANVAASAMHEMISEGRCRRPVVVDAYYYKLLAKLRYLDISDRTTFDRWRSLPQPEKVIELKIDAREVLHRVRLRHDREGRDLDGLERFAKNDEFDFIASQNAIASLMLEECAGVSTTQIDGNQPEEAVLSSALAALAALARTTDASNLATG
ncbi:MAG: hypothetical protein R3A47_05495 [Polyangiales bacterium]